MNSSANYVQDEFLESLLADFLDESSMLLDKLNEDLLTLDEWAAAAGPDDRFDNELMNNMFRSAHSIKGLSSMLGLQNINTLTHKIENVFDAARKDELRFDQRSIEAVFQSVDTLIAMIERLRDEGDDHHDSTAAVAALQKVLGVDESDSRGGEQSIDQDAPGAAAAGIEAGGGKREGGGQNNRDDKDEPVDHFEDVADETDLPAKYLSIFIDEAELSLDSLTETLLHAELQDDHAARETLLITSHRIKGSAASLGLNRPAKLAHLMEDLVQVLRESGGRLSGRMADAMLKCTDALRVYVNGLRSGSPESENFNDLALQLLAARDEALAGAEAAKRDTAKPHVSAGESAPAATTHGPPAADAPSTARALMQQLAAEGFSGALVRVRFVPQLLLAGLKGRLAYEKSARHGDIVYCDPEADCLDELDDLTSLTLVLKDSEHLDHLRSALMVAGVTRVEIEPFGDAPAAEGDGADSALPKSKPAKTETAAKETDAAPPAGAVPRPGSRLSKPRGRESTSKPGETLRVDVERLNQLMKLAGQLVINKARLTQIGESLRELAPNKQSAHWISEADGLAGAILADVDRCASASLAAVDLELLRSNARRLQNDLAGIHREMSRMLQARSQIVDLFEAVHQLDRVTEGIQRNVMDTRMAPIGPLFGRFKRVVRDITRSSGKQIELVIHGEKTELDKQMIDELGDPLIHMVRNSADHGIEAPDVRAAAGKPAQGQITLNAFHRGNSIVIEVGDDGKGLDREKIVAKAIEKNVVTAADAERMTAHQVYQLIWEPGFSTADQVTDISGRGMGMDIVRSKIEELSGAVEVDSTPGQGAVFTIKLPLTLAILPSLLAEIDGDVFAFPVESVVEIVSVKLDEMSSVHGLATATIRGRIISVVKLSEVFQWNRPAQSAPAREPGDCALVILGQQGREIGLAVDHLLGEKDVVIKSMAENYRNVAGIAGASILGDGRVSLIMDVPALIEMSAAGGAAASNAAGAISYV